MRCSPAAAAASPFLHAGIIALAVGFVLYPLRIDLPSFDHIPFMAERDFFTNHWDFFVHALSYNRTRLTFQGDVYLFRPGLMAWLAISDALWRDSPLMLGTTAILLHLACALTLYGLTRRLAGPWVGLALGLAFALPGVGVEIVIRRHVNGYLFAPLLVGLALARIRKPGAGDAFAAGALWFAAGLFHEFAALAALLSAGIYGVAARLGRPERKKALIREACILSVAALACFGLNLLDYLRNGSGAALLGPADNPQAVLWSTVLDHLALLLSATGRITFLPLSLAPHEALPTSFRFADAPIAYTSGLLLCLTVWGAALWTLRGRLRGPCEARALFVPVASLSSLTVLLGALAALRGGLRGLDYIHFALPYYAPLLAFFTFALTADALAHAFAQHKTPLALKVRPAMEVVLGLLLVSQAIVGARAFVAAAPTVRAAETMRLVLERRDVLSRENRRLNSLFFHFGNGTVFRAPKAFPRVADPRQLLPFYLRDRLEIGAPDDSLTAITHHVCAPDFCVLDAATPDLGARFERLDLARAPRIRAPLPPDHRFFEHHIFKNGRRVPGIETPDAESSLALLDIDPSKGRLKALSLKFEEFRPFHLVVNLKGPFEHRLFSVSHHVVATHRTVPGEVGRLGRFHMPSLSGPVRFTLTELAGSAVLFMNRTLVGASEAPLALGAVGIGLDDLRGVEVLIAVDPATPAPDGEKPSRP